MAANTDTDVSIRVLLADDHTMFRQGPAGILASYAGMEVVAEVPNDADALRLAREREELLLRVPGCGVLTSTSPGRLLRPPNSHPTNFA